MKYFVFLVSDSSLSYVHFVRHSFLLCQWEHFEHLFFFATSICISGCWWTHRETLWPTRGTDSTDSWLTKWGIWNKVKITRYQLFSVVNMISGTIQIICKHNDIVLHTYHMSTHNLHNPKPISICSRLSICYTVAAIFPSSFVCVWVAFMRYYERIKKLKGAIRIVFTVNICYPPELSVVRSFRPKNYGE